MQPYFNIKAIRKARGMTQEQVGILAGMSKSQVSRMEKGELGSPETYERVLLALGYRIVIQLEDVREEGELDRERVLSMLKLYFQYNKERFGIEKIGLFGSFARGEARPDSDIDIFISLKTPNLLTYASIAHHLETVFGRPIDLISAKSKLNDGFRRNIEKEVIYVF